MATKKKTENYQGDLESQAAKEATERWLKYAKLSGFFFNGSESAPYLVNEIKKGNEFYQMARDLAEEMEIDWKKMTGAESNRIMLAMLEDTFMAINKPEENKKYVLNISVMLVDKEEKK